jgi:hypothetical protein
MMSQAAPPPPWMPRFKRLPGVRCDKCQTDDALCVEHPVEGGRYCEPCAQRHRMLDVDPATGAFEVLYCHICDVDCSASNDTTFRQHCLSRRHMSRIASRRRGTTLMDESCARQLLPVLFPPTAVDAALAARLAGAAPPAAQLETAPEHLDLASAFAAVCGPGAMGGYAEDEEMLLGCSTFDEYTVPATGPRLGDGPTPPEILASLNTIRVLPARPSRGRFRRIFDESNAAAEPSDVTTELWQAFRKDLTAHHVFGFDLEGTTDGRIGPHILQLATPTRVWVIELTYQSRRVSTLGGDVHALFHDDPAVSSPTTTRGDPLPELRALVAESSKLLVGFGVSRDRMLLARILFPDTSPEAAQRLFRASVLDLGNVFWTKDAAGDGAGVVYTSALKDPTAIVPFGSVTALVRGGGAPLGASQVCLRVFGKMFTKPRHLASSDWGVRPLSMHQLLYAARDAMAPLLVYLQLQQWLTATQCGQQIVSGSATSAATNVDCDYKSPPSHDAEDI